MKKIFCLLLLQLLIVSFCVTQVYAIDMDSMISKVKGDRISNSRYRK